MSRYVFVLAPLLALSGCVIHTQPGSPSDFEDPPASEYAGWEKLGSRLVNGKGDRDSIHVGRLEGRFAALRFKVRHSSMKMHDVVVVFEDGSKYSPNTPTFFDRGTLSKVYDLPGTRRAIRRIDFRYSDLPGGGAAEVEVWAR